MENNWYDNQNPQNRYQSYYQPSNSTEPNGRKRFSFGQVLVCLLVVALISGCIGIGSFYLLYAARTNADTQEAALGQDGSVVIETPAPQKEAAEPPQKEEPAAEEIAPFVPDGNASKNLSLSTDTSNALLDPNVTIIQNCMATAVGITTKVPASAYYNVYGIDPNAKNDDSEEIEYGTGSGIILTPDGYIVTCAHVISGGKSVYVCLQDGTEYKAQVVGKDDQTDIAILKIDASNLPVAVLGNSAAAIVGEKVYAVGNPLGEFICSVSTGIISGLNRTLDLDGQKLTLIQTDAAVNPGNSGGGLFNSKGELIGVVNAKTRSVGVEGLGFAIPVDSVKSIIADLMDLGYVSGRPYLGVTLQDVYVRSTNSSDPFSDMRGYFGYGYTTHTQISSVEKGSAAEKAGLKTGDVILRMDDKEVTSASALTSMLYEYKVGDTVKIKVLRENEAKDIDVKLGERSA